METLDHYLTKRYLEFISGGYVEVLESNKKYDVASHSRRIYFEYERCRRRFKYEAERLAEKISNQNAFGVLVVEDEEKEIATQMIGKEYPQVIVKSKSELITLYPGLVQLILENAGRHGKERRLIRRLILLSDKSPLEKVVLLAQNGIDRVRSILFG